MLIRFVTSNFLSFDKEVELSLIPGRTRRHKEHVVKDNAWNGIDLLRAAVIYGANASGKSNLVRAMDFARNLIVEGTKSKQSIPVKCHRLRKECSKTPSKFEFEFKQNNTYYIYGFELDANIIYTEWLYRTNSKTSKLIYERKTTNNGDAIVKFGNIEYLYQKDKKYIRYIARGTHANQLFLTESVQRKIKQFEEVYSWFDETLKIIFPESKYVGKQIYPEIDNVVSSSLVNYLKQFDAGIENITLEPLALESVISDFPDYIKNDVLSQLKPDEFAVIHGPEEQRFVIRMEKDYSLKLFKLMSAHKIRDTGETVLFDIGDESDGTLRMLELIPVLTAINENPVVYIIDELDRSLHPNLSKRLVQQFLSLDRQRNNQMIVTTHESNMLDFNLLRKDEIWFVEKDQNGATTLYSLEEYSPRYDKDIRKGYLLGRFGAIPFLGRIRT